MRLLSAVSGCEALVLSLLDSFSFGHRLDMVPAGDPFALRDAPAEDQVPYAAETMAELRAGAATYARMLSHPSPGIREWAAALLGGISAPGELIVQALDAALSRETDTDVLAALALCWGRYGPAERVRPLLEAEECFVRGAAAVACVWSGETLTERVRQVLLETALCNLPHPSAWGVNTGVLSLSIGALARADAEAEIRQALEVRLDRGECSLSDGVEAWSSKEYFPSLEEMTCGSALFQLATAYAPLGFAEFVEREEPALLSELSSVQRKLLEKTARAGVPIPVRAIPWMPLEGEVDAPSLLRFLEGQSGPLERPLRLADGSLDATWRALHRVADPNCREETGTAVLSALFSSRAPAEIHELCLDVQTGAYPHYAGAGRCLAPAHWARLVAHLERAGTSLELSGSELTPVDQAKADGSPTWDVEAEPHALKEQALASMQELGRYPQQARELLHRVCSPAELLALLAEWEQKPWSTSHRAVPLLEYVTRCRSPEVCVGVTRTQDGLHFSVPPHRPLSADSHNTSAPPKLHELWRIFQRPPDVLRLELDFDDVALGYRIQQRLSQLEIASVRRGNLRTERCGDQCWDEAT
ncbi:MAG: hypothetical protein R3B07_02405 [Polyangiaceae bacterium]